MFTTNMALISFDPQTKVPLALTRVSFKWLFVSILGLATNYILLILQFREIMKCSQILGFF